MAKQILSLTEGYAIVKIVGTGTETISLKTDLMSATQEQEMNPYGDTGGDEVPQKVGINFLQWTCADAGIDITRNSVKVVEIRGTPGSLDFSSDFLSTDYTESESDIVVNMIGDGTLLMKLRKAKGYSSKIEPEYFGQYDNPNKVGE